MVNIFICFKQILRLLLKLLGMAPRRLEIEPGTVMNFWAPRRLDPSKPSLLFLHGFGVDGMLHWFFQVIYFSRKYAIFDPDFLFFGDSITDRPELTIEFQAECVAKGLKILGVKRCTCIGLSYGGMVTFKLANMYPELVDVMVISGAVVEFTESISNSALNRIGFSSWADVMLPRDVEGVKKLLWVCSHSFPWMPNFFYQHFLEAMMNDNRKEGVELLEALAVRDEDAKFPEYSQRMLLLWGYNDKIFTIEDANNIKIRYGVNATLESMHDTGHINQVERPFVYNSQLNRFLASIIEADVHHVHQHQH